MERERGVFVSLSVSVLVIVYTMKQIGALVRGGGCHHVNHVNMLSNIKLFFPPVAS
mgnify:CR=1 FL=1